MRNYLYAINNSPECFKLYFEETLEKFDSSGKPICILSDFNIDLLQCETCHYSHAGVSVASPKLLSHSNTGVSKRWVLITIRLGFVIIYLNQSSERNMIDIPGCSERTNFKLINL